MQGTKTLYLIRHAKSSHKDPSLDDFDRPLNKRGKKYAPFMGQKLKEKGVFPDLIISSPANRTLATAIIFAENIGYRPEKIIQEEKLYLCSRGKYLEVINSIKDDYITVFIFAHNPSTTSIANYLAGTGIDNVPTSGIVSVTFNVNSWKEVDNGTGTLNFFDFPKNYPERP